MRRREFLTLVGGATALSPIGAVAEPVKRVWRISHVLLASPNVMGPMAKNFEQRLIDLGYVPGRNLRLVHRFSEPKDAEGVIVGLLPSTDLLVIWTTFGSVIAKRLASNIPVVFLAVGAPIELGLVASLAHPGGNMTGVTFEAANGTYGLRLQILTEIVPNIKRVAVLRTIGDANVTLQWPSLEQAAPQLGVTLLPIDIRSADELAQAFETMTAEKAQAVIVISSAVTYGASSRIAELALAHHLPSCGPFREAVAAGGLVSLGPDMVEMAGQGAIYADKIMRGAKPSELPVEQPTRYEIYVNLKTAKALGLTMPPALLARADKVIE